MKRISLPPPDEIGSPLFLLFLGRWKRPPERPPAAERAGGRRNGNGRKSFFRPKKSTTSNCFPLVRYTRGPPPLPKFLAVSALSDRWRRRRRFSSPPSNSVGTWEFGAAPSRSVESREIRKLGGRRDARAPLADI